MASSEGSHVACVVTGANRGIGLALVERCVDAGWSVVCACRDPGQGEEQLAPLRPRLAPGRRLAAVGLALAGAARAGREALAAMAITDTKAASKEELLRIFEVNVVGTLQVCQALVPLLGLRKVLNISSRQGSLELAFKAAREDGIPEGAGPYGVSKAAQNMLSRQLAICYKAQGVAVVAVSPGWVATDMGSMGGRTPRLTAAESAAGLFSVAEKLTMEQTGLFLNYDGSTLPF